MNLIKVSKNIIMIPKAFEERDDITVFELLKDSGYFEAHFEIGVKELQSALSKNSQHINDWYTYSSNKRDGGWSIKKDGKNLLRNTKTDVSLQFENEMACVCNFIKKEIEVIRQC